LCPAWHSCGKAWGHCTSRDTTRRTNSPRAQGQDPAIACEAAPISQLPYNLGLDPVFPVFLNHSSNNFHLTLNNYTRTYLKHPTLINQVRLNGRHQQCIPSMVTSQLTSLALQTPSRLYIMPFTYHKGVGGRHFGTSVSANRHGVHRGPWRFSFGKFNCFR